VRRCILVLLVLAALLSGACAQSSPAPDGNYIAPIIPEVFETAVFCGNTLELCNPRDGTRLYECEIIEDGGDGRYLHPAFQIYSKDLRVRGSARGSDYRRFDILS